MIAVSEAALAWNTQPWSRVHKYSRELVLGFKSFNAAQGTLAGIELMHMIKKRQMVVETGDEGRTAAEQFYSLAA